MSPRAPLINVDHITIILRTCRAGYEIIIGQTENRTAYFEIWAVALDDNQWKRQPFSARFPAKLLRQFAAAFTHAADLIDARRSAGGEK